MKIEQELTSKNNLVIELLNEINLLKAQLSEREALIAMLRKALKPSYIFYMIEVERVGWLSGKKEGRLSFTHSVEDAITFFDKHSAEIIMYEFFGSSKSYMHPTTYGGVSVTEHMFCNAPDVDTQATAEAYEREVMAKARKEYRKELLPKMVDRFLSWKLPKNFSPDAGISFTPKYNVGTPYEKYHEPMGTNLFDAEQAKSMVAVMLGGISNEQVDNMTNKLKDSFSAAKKVGAE